MINFADEPTVKDYLRSFRRHWGVLLFVFLLAAAIGVQQAFFVKPSYRSTATIVMLVAASRRPCRPTSCRSSTPAASWSAV